MDAEYHRKFSGQSVLRAAVRPVRSTHAYTYGNARSSSSVKQCLNAKGGIAGRQTIDPPVVGTPRRLLWVSEGIRSEVLIHIGDLMRSVYIAHRFAFLPHQMIVPSRTQKWLLHPAVRHTEGWTVAPFRPWSSTFQSGGPGGARFSSMISLHPQGQISMPFHGCPGAPTT